MFTQWLMIPVVLLAVVGLVFVIRYLTLRVFSSEDDACNWIVVPLGKENNDVEFSLRAAANRFKWGFFDRKDKVICLDCGVDNESKKICEAVCSLYSFMEVKKIDDTQLKGK